MTGTRFGTSKGKSTVLFSGTSASVVSWTDSKVIVKIPTGVSKGTQSVIVQTDSGDSNAAVFVIQ